MMLINAEEINSILFEAGTDITNRGKKYFEQNRVKVADFNFISENKYVNQKIRNLHRQHSGRVKSPENSLTRETAGA